MNMKLGLGAALLAASLLVGGTASAATCKLTDVVVSIACIGELPASGSPSASDISGLGGTSLWQEVGVIDGSTTSLLFKILNDAGDATGIGETSGTWSIVNPVAGQTYALSLKAATFFTAYIVTGSSGTWSTAALTNDKLKPQDLSNAVLFSTNSANIKVPGIPLPAGMPLMLAGLGVMAFLARRKARKA